MKCFWIFAHRYTKWEDYKYYCSTSSGTDLIVQKRTCVACGRVQLRNARNGR